MATTSQGSYEGAISVKIKNSSSGEKSSRLDASDLSTVAERVYVNGLPLGPPEEEGSGITHSVTYTAWGSAAPVAGDEGTFAGVTGKYTDVETEYAVGELVKFTATIVSD